jgi:hypothetical protein
VGWPCSGFGSDRSTLDSLVAWNNRPPSQRLLSPRTACCSSTTRR